MLTDALLRQGRPREVEFREVINAVRYLVRSGCGWRMLPVHFGPWQTVYGWFRELARRSCSRTIHDLELMLDREREAERPVPPEAASTARPSRPRRPMPSGVMTQGRKSSDASVTSPWTPTAGS